MPEKHPLVGWCFLSYKDGKTQWQGEIIAIIPNAPGDLALCQLFEWFSGSASTCHLIPIAELAIDERFSLFRSNDDRNAWHEAHRQR